MKRTFLLASILIFALIFNTINAQEWVSKMQSPDVNFHEVQKSFYQYWEGKTVTKGNGWKQFKRWEHFMAPRVNDEGKIPRPAITWESYKSSIAKQNGIKSQSLGNWKHLGPVDVPTNGGAGRLNGIAFHPTNPDIMHVGAPSGGLWTTTDGASSWSTNTDDLASIGISDIIINYNNPDIVYAATGDADAGDTYSLGVIKSLDGGKTWQATDLAYTVQDQIRIKRLIMHPNNPEELYAAANNGLYKTTDGGDNWNKIKPGFFYDVAYKPGNPNTVYLAASNNVYKSTDSGQSFSTLKSLNFNFSAGRLAIGVTPADTNYVYILASDDTDNSFGGLYLSTDGGNTFTQQSNSPNIFSWSADGSGSGGQAWYNMAIAVSPLNENDIIVGGINLWRSSDAGSNWDLSGHWRGNNAPYVHADIHRIKYYPNTDKIYACTDGGLFVSPDNGTTWNDYSDGLAIAQIYRMGASENTREKIITGWQDNGTNLKSNGWAKIRGGDGMEAIIDYSDDDIMYASLYYGRIYRTKDNGGSWTDISDNIPGSGAWVTPYVQDPNIRKTLYVGYDDIYKSNNRGATWNKISNFGGAKFQEIAVAPSNSNHIYAATYNNLYYTDDGGKNWANITGSVSSSITYIAVHPSNPEKAYITSSNYIPGNKVYKTTDAGNNWKNISGNLPNIPANTIVYKKNSPNGIYVGTDAGVYYRDTTLNDWLSFSDGLPNVIVNELEIHYKSGMLRAATYGRGLWESKLNTSVDVEDNVQPEKKLTVYPNPARDVLTVELPDNSKEYNVKIYSVNGKLVNEEKIKNQNNMDINVSSLKRGVYYIRLTDNTQIYSGSFVKTN